MNNVIHCPKCEDKQHILYGSAKGKKRYRCKNCSCQFTKSTTNGKTTRTKISALMLYLSGFSMNMVGKIVGVSRQAVMQWIRNFDKEFYLPKERGKVTEVELNKIGCFIKKSGESSGSEKFYVAKLEEVSVFIVANVPKK